MSSPAKTLVPVESRGSRYADLPEDPRFPRYSGVEWVHAELPVRFEEWPLSKGPLAIAPGFHLDELGADELREYAANKPWVWPSRRIVLLTDVHADADAFVDSLVASGTVARTGPGPDDFELMPEAEGVLYIIAGDCLDKGPHNLRLLLSLKRFIDLGADVELLVGNHDLRAMIGMLAAGRKEPHLAHLFVRMGQKVVPLLAQLRERYGSEVGGEGSEQAAHDKYFPDEAWFEGYRAIAEGIVPGPKIDQELVRLRQKVELFETACENEGISMRELHSIVEHFKAQFLSEGGEFSWFFPRMKVAHREGSLLFVHAGLGDRAVDMLVEGGVNRLNTVYEEMIERDELFELYHGPIGNCFRTKYRDTDHPLTRKGVERLWGLGIHAIVHGHRSLSSGQRMMFREGVLNFECDCGIDRMTRAVVGTPGRGAATTLFYPDASVVGISADRPGAKLLDLKQYAECIAVLDTSAQDLGFENED